jgi:hypothetical protein
VKALLLVFILCSVSLASTANGPYRNYLLSKIYVRAKPAENNQSTPAPVLGSSAFIPRFERPKGAIFCRMEDKVTKATKVWLKIGVQ